MSRGHGALREGFTTGTAAAAAAKACVLLLCGAPHGSVGHVDVPTPHGTSRLLVPVAQCGRDGVAAWAEVIKDGGDDPDATHGALIRSRVVLHPATLPSSREILVRIEGGHGVGRFTLPGLPLPPGHAAINPGPRKQIALAVAEALAETLSPCREADVLVEAPQGGRIATKTMNARLGIIGGISILGTSGVVKPFSHAAWRATVEAGLNVAKALGRSCVGLCTGRRSERLLQGVLPELDDASCVQMADLFSHALQAAANRGFSRIVISCYGGKLAKMAQGLAHTHASSGQLDFAALARRCQRLGMPPDLVRRARSAVTARHVFDLAEEAGLDRVLAAELAQSALAHAIRHVAGVQPLPHLELYAFSHTDALLAVVHSPSPARRM